MGWNFSGGNPFFISGGEVEAPLHTGGGIITDRITSTGPLFIGGPVGNNSSTTMYVLGEQKSPTSSTNLYVYGDLGNSSNSPLFVKGKDVNSTSLPLWVDGLDVDSNVTNLFINGRDANNSSAPLYTAGYGKQTAVTTLFVGLSILNLNSRPNLFITGGQLTAFHQHSLLYLFGGSNRCESMNMFVQTVTPTSINLYNQFCITGTVNKGQFKSVPLTIIGREMARTMNLVITGKDSGGQGKIMGLVVNGRQSGRNGSVALTVANHNQFYGDSSALFLKGLGVNPGYLPVGESIGLHVQRGPYDGVTLYVQNNGQAGSAPLYILGAPSLTNHAPLTVTGLGGTTANNTPCFTAGGEFTSANGSATLLVPKVMDFKSETAFLFTSGFEY